MVLPGNFLPLLEEAQTISQVDFFVFEFICSKVKEWADREKQAFPVSVNFFQVFTGPVLLCGTAGEAV